MEKRQLIKPLSVAKDETPLQVAKVLVTVAEKSLLNAEVTISAHRALAKELATHSAAIQAIANAVKPQSKIIDVTVTKRDSSGRPSNYRIEVN